LDSLNLSQILNHKLKKFPADNGEVLQALKSEENGYQGFGEVYFSWINKGSIKAWKMHSKMIMNLIVPIGQVKFVFFVENGTDDREFRIIEIGENNYQRLTVPAGIWFGFKGLGKSNSLICNISNIVHSESEVIRKDANIINFNWNSNK
jgi:dTDP-4-dehydrorhamnose 3,5-epimerase